jgi:hypothetical protein
LQHPETLPAQLLTLQATLHAAILQTVPDKSVPALPVSASIISSREVYLPLAIWRSANCCKSSGKGKVMIVSAGGRRIPVGLAYLRGDDSLCVTRIDEGGKSVWKIDMQNDYEHYNHS